MTLSERTAAAWRGAVQTARGSKYWPGYSLVLVEPETILAVEAELAAANKRAEAARQAAITQSREVEQALGKVLGYPWYKDDQTNFPAATEAHGVCVGDHTATSLADEAAARIVSAERALVEARADIERLTESRCANCGKVASKAKHHITGGDVEEDEWFCSVECHEQHEELGCPMEHHAGYRHPVETTELLAGRRALAEARTALGAYADLACWRPDHEQPGSPLVIWDGRGNGPNLAREALGLPKVGERST